jgi:hypothetical protein
MTERVVCIEWEGPYLYRALIGDDALLNGPADRGLYQIYVHHPLYGAGVLAYIGLALNSSFHNRICGRRWGEGSENDPKNVEVYVGRLMYPPDAMLSPDLWSAECRKFDHSTVSPPVGARRCSYVCCPLCLRYTSRQPQPPCSVRRARRRAPQPLPTRVQPLAVL